MQYQLSTLFRLRTCDVKILVSFNHTLLIGLYYIAPPYPQSTRDSICIFIVFLFDG